MTAPVFSDGTATYTPGVSEVRGGVSTFTTGGLKNQDAQWSSSGAHTATRTYDAFGNLVSSSGVWQGPFGYGGGFGYQEDATGLKLLGHRHYDPSTGRFLTRDPIKDGRNWYAYCGGDPITGVDPAGLALILVGSRPVVGGGGAGGHHAWIAIIDEVSGDVYTVSGGPEHHGINPRGRVTNYSEQLARSGQRIKSNYEHQAGIWLSDGLVIHDDGKSAVRWFVWLNSFASRIQDADHPYKLLSSNSNSFVSTILVLAGLLDDFSRAGGDDAFSPNRTTAYPGGSKWLPGWGTFLTPATNPSGGGT